MMDNCDLSKKNLLSKMLYSRITSVSTDNSKLRINQTFFEGNIACKITCLEWFLVLLNVSKQPFQLQKEFWGQSFF